MGNFKYLIVVGASAGGLPVINSLISKIPAKIDAAFFCVLHISKSAIAKVLIQSLQNKTELKCMIAENNLTIEKGHFYLAPPDFHLLIHKDNMILTKGPHENRWRPSIDALFRSAAAAFGSRTIGIVLTGLLDDGTSGMGAIKRSGGICIVQDPQEAQFNDMPQNVINNVEVDYRLSANDISYVLEDICSKPLGPEKEAPEEVKIEAQITERMTSSIDQLAKIGEHSNFTCPDCGGGLWEINGEHIHRYRCHTGHVYTEKVLLEKQNEVLEDSLWVAIRLLEERRNLLMSVSQHEKELKNSESAAEKKLRAEEMKTHIERLKFMLMAINGQTAKK